MQLCVLWLLIPTLNAHDHEGHRWYIWWIQSHRKNQNHGNLRLVSFLSSFRDWKSGALPLRLPCPWEALRHSSRRCWNFGERGRGGREQYRLGVVGSYSQIHVNYNVCYSSVTRYGSGSAIPDITTEGASWDHLLFARTMEGHVCQLSIKQKYSLSFWVRVKRCLLWLAIFLILLNRCKGAFFVNNYWRPDRWT